MTFTSKRLDDPPPLHLGEIPDAPAGSPTFLDLFSGAGGLSLGLLRAGWTPLAAVDNWQHAVDTKPSATRCVHPFQDRGLTAREGARLQSFPDSFVFLHGAVSQQLQIANAVPPLLGAALGKAILDPDRWV